MAMGLHLIEEARLRSIEKLVEVGTIASYPRHTPVPFHEKSLWDGYPDAAHALAIAYGDRGCSGVSSFWGAGEEPNISDEEAW